MLVVSLICKKQIYNCLIISTNSVSTPTQVRTISLPTPTTVGDGRVLVGRWQGLDRRVGARFWWACGGGG